eukprot:10290780-Ditylum_brightwellii.AAC.1
MWTTCSTWSQAQWWLGSLPDKQIFVPKLTDVLFDLPRAEYVLSSAEQMVGTAALSDQQVRFCPVGLSLQPLNALSASSSHSPSPHQTK